VTLGIVPGAGGTQRLPRLVGVACALRLIAGGTRIDAEEALQIGLIDAIARGDLLAEAQDLARRLAGQKRRVMDRRPPPEPEAEIASAEAALIRRRGVRPNLVEALRLTRLATTAEGAAALAEERAAFQRLRLGADAFALRHLFFAERAAAAPPGLVRSAQAGIATVGVVGGGTMGRGIARAVLDAGLSLRLAERDPQALAAALAHLRDGLVHDHQRGRLDAAALAQRMARLQGVDLAGLAGCDLVIEAIYEDLSAKTALLRALGGIVAPDALLASNTSYLDIDRMVADLPHPDRVLGLHFFSPAQVMRLIEIVRASQTSDAALGRAFAFARRLGKQPVLAGLGEGFIGNRIYAAYRRAAELLVLEGASPDQVDAALVDFGFAMGVFDVSDLSGLDIAWAMRKRRAATRPPDERYCRIADRLCERGRLGRKTGGGWYDHAEGRRSPSAITADIIAEERALAGIVARPIAADEIQALLMAAILNEAACVLEDGIAARPGDIDVTLVHGYGFPRWRGGPVFWMRGQDRAQIAAAQAALARLSGPTHRAGDLQRLWAD
ncbi:3-hydroxyacyl-CoA dehydrogenase family protein, partial [Xinfangfangia pollutisoli]|uniref:3-hydroxyacyl-CoA dehydrogenase family protein n=1 Tax=Xinfangfangia pollutisoli TaxID=2865960 RepID=UPI001CD4C681